MGIIAGCRVAKGVEIQYQLPEATPTLSPFLRAREILGFFWRRNGSTNFRDPSPSPSCTYGNEKHSVFLRVSGAFCGQPDVFLGDFIIFYCLVPGPALLRQRFSIPRSPTKKEAPPRSHALTTQLSFKLIKINCESAVPGLVTLSFASSQLFLKNQSPPSTARRGTSHISTTSSKSCNKYNRARKLLLLSLKPRLRHGHRRCAGSLHG